MSYQYSSGSFSYLTSSSSSENGAVEAPAGYSLLSSNGVSSNESYFVIGNGSGRLESYENYAASNNAGTVNQVANDLLTLSSSNNYSSGNVGTVNGSYGVVSASSNESSSLSSSTYLSSIEQAILRSTVPIDVNETEEITVNGQRGIWANKAEVSNWRGAVPINEYSINEDSNPEVVVKKVNQRLEYVQELAIRFLRPPTPPAPGEIVIVQQESSLTPPAPPLIIRQQPPRPSTPEPLVVREAPPQPPSVVGRKVITISGKRLPPPPRKVVIERLAPLPAKPQSVLVERWLPYSQLKRRVIFQRTAGSSAVVVRPRNVIVQWEAPQVTVRKEIKYLGIVRANPIEYVQRYGSQLRASRDLPQFVLDIKTPDGLVLAADFQFNSVYELEGDLEALRLIDFDREGLSEYRTQIERFRVQTSSSTALLGTSVNVSSSGAATSAAISDVFAELDTDRDGSLSVDEARRAFLLLNSRLGRRYGENEVVLFFQVLDSNRNGLLSLEEFRAAYERL